MKMFTRGTPGDIGEKPKESEMLQFKRYFYDTTQTNAGKEDENDQGKDGGKSQQKDPIDFATWLKDQPAELVSAYENNVKGLKGALVNERTSRQDLEKKLRDLAKKAEAGSEAQGELTKMANEVSESQRRSDFYEAAHAAGVTNLKLAYVIAAQDDLFDSKGRVNFETMRTEYPELFGSQKKTAKTNAGTGSGPNSSSTNMNDYIRAASGRSPS